MGDFTPLSSQTSSAPVAKQQPALSSDHDDVVHDESHMTAVKEAIKSFILRTMSPQCVQFEPPDSTAIHAQVLKELNDLGIDIDLVTPWISMSCHIGMLSFPRYPVELQAFPAVVTILTTCVDDTYAQYSKSVLAFQRAVITGDAHAHPVLACLDKKIVPRLWKYFELLPANLAAASFYEFINGVMLEDLSQRLTPNPAAVNFPQYVRVRSGFPGFYAYWTFLPPEHPDCAAYIQAIPDVIDLINYGNDILSFYKEELAGEKDNYIHVRARIQGKSIITTLEEICEEVVIIVNNIFATLKDNPAAQRSVREFIDGYFSFHLVSNDRYFLKDLFKHIEPL